MLVAERIRSSTRTLVGAVRTNRLALVSQASPFETTLFPQVLENAARDERRCETAPAPAHCYRPCVNAIRAWMASSVWIPAARNAVAGASAGPFNQGRFASIPRVTGCPSGPPKSIGHQPFGTTSTVNSGRRNPLPSTASGSSGATSRAEPGSLGSPKVRRTGISAPVTGTEPVILLISLNDTLALRAAP